MGTSGATGEIHLNFYERLVSSIQLLGYAFFLFGGAIHQLFSKEDLFRAHLDFATEWKTRLETNG